MKTKMRHGHVLHDLTEEGARPYEKGGVVTLARCGMRTFSLLDHWMTDDAARDQYPNMKECDNCKRYRKLDRVA